MMLIYVKNFFICNFIDMNVLFENKVVFWNFGGGRYLELKIVGFVDVLIFFNG